MTDFAKVNVTYGGQNGDMPGEVPVDATRAQIIGWLTETLQTGGIPGIAPVANVDLENFVVDAPFPPTPERPYALITVRPKTPYG